MSAHKAIRLCKDCKFFVPPSMLNVPLRYGACAKSALVNLVDGFNDLEYASIYRKYDCMGDWWTPRDPCWPNGPSNPNGPSHPNGPTSSSEYHTESQVSPLGYDPSLCPSKQLERDVQSRV